MISNTVDTLFHEHEVKCEDAEEAMDDDIALFSEAGLSQAVQPLQKKALGPDAISREVLKAIERLHPKTQMQRRPKLAVILQETLHG